jgi:hypothetical protein
MSRRHPALLRIAAPLLGALLALLSATAQRVGAQQQATMQESNAQWLARCQRRERGEREEHCEVREYTLPASGSLNVDARPNGGVEVVVSSANEIHVAARVQTYGSTQAQATALASQLRIETGGASVRASGPNTSNGRGWAVSYVVSVPRQTNLELESVNGGLSVTGVTGNLDLGTTNGGISLDGVAGDVLAHTTNGGLNVRLAGDRWTGKGMELHTTNGGISLAVPAGFSAHLVAETRNGHVDTDFPVTMQGRLGRRIDADVGGGGPTVSLATTNGGIQIRRR